MAALDKVGTAAAGGRRSGEQGQLLVQEAGGYGWLVNRKVRRDGTAPIAVVGATVLATAVWLAADDAWRSRPDPRHSDAFYDQAAVSTSVAVKTGPDVETAVAVAVLLLGAALTVLACARLSTADSQTR